MSSEAPVLMIGGTVYPTAHEPDDCNGVSTSAGLTVFITEANGTTHSLPVNDAGNFFLRASALTTPYKAEVRSATQTRVMTHTQTSGDCNGCHTVNGSSNAPGADAAPGRIMAP
jgi:mono/diheme cytochrome c family protein